MRTPSTDNSEEAIMGASDRSPCYANSRFSCWVMGVAFLWVWAVTAAVAQEHDYIPADSYVINGPTCLVIQHLGGWFGCDSNAHESWLKYLRHWRNERRILVGYDGSRYDLSALKWTQSDFVQALVMAEERYLYDPASGKYTVDRYLDDLSKRYGGIDSVIIWPVYPNIGVDDRNQLDMIRSMPGGTAGVKQMIADFHRRGVRVWFPMNMWDQGTRDPGIPWSRAIAELMAEIGADGVYGDAQDGVPLAFLKAFDQVGHTIAFQTELDPNNEALAWNTSTWWQDDTKQYEAFSPKVSRDKWFETRHVAIVTDRWSRSKSNVLQVAFFNGTGCETWENVWGIWNGITPRDGEAVRRVATIERFVAPFLVSAEWEPFYPTRAYGVYGSRWPLSNQTVWTIVNRNEYAVDGPQMVTPFREGEHYFDLYHGTEIVGERTGDNVVLSFPIEARGFGAVLATPEPPDAALAEVMAKMKAATATPLESLSSEWHFLPQQIVPIAHTKPIATAPSGMIEIRTGEFEFGVKGIEIEGDAMSGVDVAYPWEGTPQRFHEKKLRMARFFIDQYPVSNAEYKAFMDATHYRPKDDLNFLKDWKDGTYRAGWANKPVTWVSLEDARAYATWAGKRLPHEWEWQYAAQGNDHRLYPWGNDWNADRVPLPEKDRTLRGPDDVDAHPTGASPFGIRDMVGNVWQWTDEYRDEHTRAAILRGGSYYQPQGSMWYFPQAYRNDQHGKYLLMAPSKDRSATVGFRCAADANTR